MSDNTTTSTSEGRQCEPQPQYSLEDPASHLVTNTAIDLKKRTAELQQTSKLAQVTLSLFLHATNNQTFNCPEASNI